MTPYALARRVVELEEAKNKIKADAVKQFLTDEAPRLNSEGLDSVTHCCESILYEERERLHLASDKLKRGESCT
jgi:hypothetical protein